MLSEQAFQKINSLSENATRLGAEMTALENGFASLGYQILEMVEMGYWKLYFPTWAAYRANLAQDCGISEDRLQRYWLTVRDLLPHFKKEDIEKMGITKSMMMRSMISKVGAPSAEVTAVALDSTKTAKDLKRIIALIAKLPEDEPGEYADFEMEFMVTPEEKATIDDGIQAALNDDPPVSEKIAKPMRMKEAILRLSMEFLAAHPVEGTKSD